MLSYAILKIFSKVMKSHEIMPGGSPGCNDRCNCYFSFWAIFCPLTAQKIKILKK